MAVIMKSVTLGQQGSMMSARQAGRELLGSTYLGGCLDVPFWFSRKISPTLWMFFLWVALLAVYFAGKLYGVLASRYRAWFCLNVFMTMLILLGPTVADRASGSDAYAAFASRMTRFVAVMLYAWLAIFLREQLRSRLPRVSPPRPQMEEPPC